MNGPASVPPEPVAEADPDSDLERRRRRLRLSLIIGVLALALAAMALIVWSLSPGSGPTPVSTGTAASSPSETPTSVPGSPTPTPTPTPTATATPTASPTPTGGAEVAAVPQPTNCEQLYSAAMVENFSELALNPAWTQVPGVDVRSGSDDAELRQLIDANERLTCLWVSPAGPSGTGLTTQVVAVSAPVSAAAQSRMTALGMDCFAEASGQRCITSTTSDDGAFGESHFLRNGIWIATQWSNIAPVGYTADIVDNLWPEG
ncbi:MAG: hypothetical protein R6W83_12500 [Cryobacterium sp.]